MIANIIQAQIVVGTSDIRREIDFFTRQLGFKLAQIMPADDPTIAVVFGHGIEIRIDKNASAHPPALRIRCERPEKFSNGKIKFQAPNGMPIDIVAYTTAMATPATRHSFVVRHLRDSDAWHIGRAGMQYRDLIPDRLGGAIIASHIRIPGGGPVPDMVHFHAVGFQLIFCYKGWVDLVYEDQGPPFRLHAGDCVIQPPEIRHRVLFSSDDLEVIEIGVPAEHVTTIDHQMTLPTAQVNHQREFQGQTFVHHKQSEAHWSPWRIKGFTHRDTHINAATCGIANVQVAKFNVATDQISSHTADILFSFVMNGSMRLSAAGQPTATLATGDAFVIPPGLKTSYCRCSDDLEILEISLPGVFETLADNG